MPRTTRDSSSERYCPRQLRGPWMKGRYAYASTAGAPSRKRCGLNAFGSGHKSARWCTPWRDKMMRVPAGTKTPPSSSSALRSALGQYGYHRSQTRRVRTTATRVTTGTTEYRRNTSFSVAKVQSIVLICSCVGLAPGLGNTVAASCLTCSSTALQEGVSTGQISLSLAERKHAHTPGFWKARTGTKSTWTQTSHDQPK